MKKIFLAAVIFSETTWAASDFLRYTKNSPCRDNLKLELSTNLQRQTWTTKSVSVPGRPLIFGIHLHDSRTQTFHEVWNDKNISFYRKLNLKEMKELTTSWNKGEDCKKTVSSKPAELPPLAATDGFTDKDLQQTLKSHQWGVIYVWTPYMPLSVAALKNIKEAVQSEGGHLTVLLDPKANIDEAKKWVSKGDILPTELVKVASYELLSHELGLHYPIAYIYKDRFLSNRDYIGHKSTEVYKKWIAFEMAELKKDL